MSRHGEPRTSAYDILHVLQDVMLGAAHSRDTIAVAAQISRQTADRWIDMLVARVPGCRIQKQRKATWLVYGFAGLKASSTSDEPLLKATPGRCPRHEEKATAGGRWRLCGCPVLEPRRRIR